MGQAKAKKKKTALLVANYYWLGYSSPLLNSISFLLDNDWTVTLLAIWPDFESYPLPEHLSSRINIIEKSTNKPFLKRTLGIGSEVWKQGYISDLAIFFDGDALLYAPFCKLLWIGRAIYYSLEFYSPVKRPKALKLCLHRCISWLSACVVTQDKARADFLRMSLVGRNFAIVPNSPREPVLSPAQRASTFEGFTLLCIGSLTKDHLVDSLIKWHETHGGLIKLKLHGWLSSEVEEALSHHAKVNGTNIEVSTEFFQHSQRWQVYADCDIVFAGYLQSNANLRLAAGSAGKLYDAIRAAKPILAIDSPGMRAIVEASQIGVVVSSFQELSIGVERIISNYDFFSANCVSAHKLYDHDRHFLEAIRRVSR